ncbi:DNA-binding transcriptional response regulator [Acetobacter orleanensis]|uniref:Response regulatory domain-containing protein n=1 Tax=Acetobacter orleanensis TaxID=104099 RepID=A0A4Y3TP39_9PROT|nr:response regulator transcription factor [Acetobacter orleanensis]KXV66600.1 hypothetical protein AD949_02110 [Acetobacter orleanensis]PCD78449.1 DNA-binding response regulator [Acetobacter orleanensis]GAN69494.1 hypothetical protein Abol_038_004 [Acetobacter orleanensis JCM 7639]GBR29394.1 hypothetical protein AA0473_2004 [Acetobacter orleanensis NRIC 0473]GEB84106.1 hypothetical protein AOR01nite_25830 [Acetobacter orleanensis]
MEILIVEDVDEKYTDIERVFKETVGFICDPRRASNLNDAEDEVMLGKWNLIILDISMDISSSGSAALNAGHATMGGLDILERMFLLKISAPTVLVTGFDSFQDADRFDNAIMNLHDISSIAANWLGAAYLGSVRYGTTNWDMNFQQIIRNWEKNESSCNSRQGKSI